MPVGYPSQGAEGIAALLGGAGQGFMKALDMQQQEKMRQAYLDALQNRAETGAGARLSAAQIAANQKAEQDARDIAAGKYANRGGKGGKAAASKADEWLANVERELASAASVYQLGNQKGLWEPTPRNLAAEAAIHNPVTKYVPGADAALQNTLPPGAFDLNAQGENATIALAKALSSGRPAASTIEMLKGHRAKIGGGRQSAQEAFDATIGSARAIAEGELAKKFYDDPETARVAGAKLRDMFGNFESGGKRNPFAQVTGETGLVSDTKPKGIGGLIAPSGPSSPGVGTLAQPQTSTAPLKTSSGVVFQAEP